MLTRRLLRVSKKNLRGFAAEIKKDREQRKNFDENEELDTVWGNYYARFENHHMKLSLWKYLSVHTKDRTKIRLAKWFSSNFDEVTPVREDLDAYTPPKLSENSVFLYQSEKLAEKYRLGKQLEIPFYLGYLALCPTLISFPLMVGVAYGMFGRAAYYEPIKRFVTRMDLIPEEEIVNFQKIGLFGRIYNTQVKVDDLEKLDKSELKENYFDYFNKKTLDKDMIFRNKRNGELFMFDKNGLWDWNNLGHELIY